MRSLGLRTENEILHNMNLIRATIEPNIVNEELRA